MSDIEKLSQDAHALRQKIRRGGQAAEKGEVIDMTPIQNEITALCSAIRTLPRPQADSMEGDLVGMIEELSHLTDKLNLGLDIIRQELQGLAERQRAVSAYGKGS